VLEHESAVAPRPGDRDAVHQNGAAVEADQALDDLEQRGLPAAALTDEGDHLSLPDIEADVAEDVQDAILSLAPSANAEALAHIADCQLHEAHERARHG
jgi:hypothetical protein